VAKPKILIGIPAWNGIVPEAQESFNRMIFRCGRDMPEYDFAIEIVVKKEQFRARNAIVDAAIAMDAQYVLMLDDDMIVPHDLVKRLVEHDKDVIGALYYQRGGAYHPVVMKRHVYETGDFRAQFLPPYDPIIINPGLHQVDIIGGGCMLFKTDVFRKVMPPYFWWEAVAGTDISICSRLLDEGIEIWADTSIELGHVGERQVVTSRTVPIGQREMALVNDQLWKDLTEYLAMGDEELNAEMKKCANPLARNEKWNAKPRDNWDGIFDYYASDKIWHLANMAYWTIHARSVFKEWALLKTENIITKESKLLDMGCGFGHLAVGMAMKYKCLVHAIDLEGSPVLEFLKWRAQRHWPQDPKVICTGIKEEVPKFNLPSLDGAFMISMMDHLTQPYETVQWVTDQIRAGGFLLCDYLHESDETNPQHLDRFDVSKFDEWMHEIGWETSPEFPWLFFKR
jgi:2-polyprenyl-3-methyl-5-hydroxy-6-metoxy-1,4-benzoquinol methylase